jgi:hypothetical protein
LLGLSAERIAREMFKLLVVKGSAGAQADGEHKVLKNILAAFR